jgi:hypothetical protein
VKIDITVPTLPLPDGVQKALLRTAILGQQIIKDRTIQGVGYQGKFAPYSAYYAALKAKGWETGKGPFGQQRAFGGDPSGVVNLTLSGEMLADMQTSASGNVASIYFANAQLAQRAAFNNRKRPFFGFNTKEGKRLADYFKKQVLK